MDEAIGAWKVLLPHVKLRQHKSRIAATWGLGDFAFQHLQSFIYVSVGNEIYKRQQVVRLGKIRTQLNSASESGAHFFSRFRSKPHHRLIVSVSLTAQRKRVVIVNQIVL